MTAVAKIQCPSCGLTHLAGGLPKPRGILASGECHAASSEVLAAFYQPSLVSERQYVVDAYACTHPENTTRLGVQTTALCLMTLDLSLECGQPVAEGSAMHQEMMRQHPDFFTPLEIPPLEQLPTYEMFWEAPQTEYRILAREWAEQIWQAWSPHHAQIRAWNLQLVPHRVLP